MTDDIVQELRQLAQYTAGLRDLVADAQAASPARAEGVDPTGAVHVVVGPDGLPESIRLEADWRRRVESESLGNAIGDAFRAASAERLADWGRTLESSGWQAKVERLQDGPAPAIPAGVLPEVRPRRLDRVVEDALKAFDSIDELGGIPAVTAQGTGSTAFGKLSVTLRRTGDVSCTADALWLSQQQDPEALTDSLNEALAAARADLASAAAAPHPARGLDGVLAEAFAILHDPQRATES